MTTFKVTKLEKYAADVEEVASSLAKASVDVQTTFIAKYFETLDKDSIDAIAKRLTASGFHRGMEEIKGLSSAVEHYMYQK